MDCLRIHFDSESWFRPVPRTQTSSPEKAANYEIPILGIVGGIGSGKSSVARQLSVHQPVLIIDADRIGHELLAADEIQKQIRSRFGIKVFNEQGDVNRRALAEIVFGESREHKKALNDLEDILHPEIRREMEKQIASAANDKQYAAVIIDAALLIEAGWHNLCDAIVFVDTPQAIRQERVRSRGWDDDELAKRENNQLPLSTKQQTCTHTIDNSGTLQEAGERFNQILTFPQTVLQTHHVK